MKKRAVCILLATIMLVGLMPAAASAEGGVPITFEFFPSDAIRGILSELYDLDKDGFLNDEEIANVTDISCPGVYIGSLKGIEYFTNLRYLDISAYTVYGDDSDGNPYYSRSYGPVWEIDLSHNPELRYLDISGNGEIGIDLSKNTKLEVLIIGGCPLETIDTSNMPNLKCLDVSTYPVLFSYNGSDSKSHIKSLDLSNNTELEELFCKQAQLTELDVSHNPELKYLDCSMNKLTSLDLSKNEKLVGVDMSCNGFDDIDVTHNPELEMLYCEYMGEAKSLRNASLDTLDVSHNPKLMYLSITQNSFTAFDLSIIPKLVYFECDYNKISSLDFSNNPDMLYINADVNPLESIDVTKLADLTYLSLSQDPYWFGETEGHLKELNVTNNTELEYLNCHNCGLKSLDLSKNTKLIHLICQNSIPNLDLSANTELVEVTVVNQQMRIKLEKTENGYAFDIKALVGEEDFSRVKSVTGGSYNSETGILTLTKNDTSASYVLDTGNENYPAIVYLYFEFSDISDRFVDMVPKDHWAYDAIDYVLERGIMHGTGDTTFEPNGTVTRAMVVNMLYNLAGEPAHSGENKFTDVPADAWYVDAVLWASENKIVSGKGDGIFDPNGNITREQLAIMMQNYAKFMGKDTSASEELDKFEDADTVSSWATDAVKWACANKIVSGSSDGGKLYLDPQGNAIRAQIAVIFENFCKRFEI